MPEQPRGEMGPKQRVREKFSIERSGSNMIPTEGKWKGKELSPGWRTFDGFEERKNLINLEDNSKIPVSELEGVEVELVPHEDEE